MLSPILAAGFQSRETHGYLLEHPVIGVVLVVQVNLQVGRPKEAWCPRESKHAVARRQDHTHIEAATTPR